MRIPPAALLVALLALSCNDEITGLGPPSDPATETFAPSLGVTIASMTKTASGVYYLDLLVGTGAPDTTTTDSITVSYAGFLTNGTEFDKGTSVTFVPAQLILGWRTGMLGMREGGKRKLVIPSALGYGARSVRNADGTIRIPRQSTLVFDVELLKVFNRVDTTATSSIVGR